MKSSIKEMLATVAPTVATALGGPLAGMATRAIAAKLLPNADATSDEVEAALAVASGADLAKLKQLEQEFKTQLREADIQLESIAAYDRASARERQTSMRDWTPSVLGLAIIIGFFGVLAYIFRFGLPDEGSEVLLLMVGALGAMTSQVGNFFFGSSAGSKAKDAFLSRIREVRQ